MTRNRKELKGMQCVARKLMPESHTGKMTGLHLPFLGVEKASYVYHWVYTVEPGAAFC